VKLLFDHNLSPKLVKALVDIYPESRHVRDIGLQTADDEVVWDYALQHGFTIISKDADFHQRSFLSGPPPKVVWIRRGNCTTGQIEMMLRSYGSDLLEFERDQKTAFLTLG
jgi:predicted nuclease of predicted toxin-antitoxin system